jgi:cysteine desulfurase
LKCTPERETISYTAVTEHKAVLDTCKHLEKLGAQGHYLSVTEDGIIDTAELEAAIKPETILVSIMYANNETGTIQPVQKDQRDSPKKWHPVLH